jgi:hypothetical protein
MDYTEEELIQHLKEAIASNTLTKIDYYGGKLVELRAKKLKDALDNSEAVFQAYKARVAQELPVISGDPLDDEPDKYFNKAKQLVLDELRNDGSNIVITEIYVVWFVKVLQNWKALVSTSRKDDLYFEVTYNGDRCEAYVDTYGKLRNSTYPDYSQPFGTVFDPQFRPTFSDN